jgi:hypothetical protein
MVNGWLRACEYDNSRKRHEAWSASSPTFDADFWTKHRRKLLLFSPTSVKRHQVAVRAQRAIDISVIGSKT